jgi:hypothetical protein
LCPSFETLASQAPQDEVGDIFTTSEEWRLRRVSKDETLSAAWFETRQRVRAKRGPMINSDALLTMRTDRTEGIT